jgi:hypothetical protein
MREKLRSSNPIESPFAGRDGIDTWLIWVSTETATSEIPKTIGAVGAARLPQSASRSEERRT